MNISTDKPKYRIGDKITITVTAKKNCFVWVFLMGSSDGEKWEKLLFPVNLQSKSNFIEGQLTLPDPDSDSYPWTIKGAPGTETLIAIAYAGPFDKDGKDIRQNAGFSVATAKYKIIP